MTPQERAERLLKSLPTLLQAGPNIRRIFEAMGTELGFMERATRQLLESRWYTLARGFAVGDSLSAKAASELGAIGALFDLYPGRGESAQYFRQHLAALIRIHSRGLSTARAILELVSLVYLAEQPAAIEVKEGLALGRFRVREEDDSLREVAVELVDNPPAAAAARFLGVQANQQVVTDNAGLDQAFPDIDLMAAGGDVTVPLLHQENSGLDVIFLGTICKGQTLALRHGQPALLDGYPIDGVVVIANPSRFAGSATGDHVFRFDAPESRFSVCEVSNRLSPLLPGESRWHYRTLGRSELHHYLAYRTDLAGYVDRALAEPTSPPVDLAFRWTEVTPAALELRIPAGYVPPHYRLPTGDRDWIGFFSDVQAALKYGRAAGIRATAGLTLPLPTEVVTIQEGPLEQTVNLWFAEAQPTTDRPATSEASLQLADRLATPADLFGVGGLFDRTYFSPSTKFQ